MFYQTLWISTLYLLVLLVPGFLLLSTLQIKRNRFLLSYGTSFAILVITFTVVQLFGGTVRTWLYILGSLYLLIFAASAFCTVLGLQPRGTRLLTALREGDLLKINRTSVDTRGFLCLIVIIVGYHLSVGPYTEIPSDFWEHLARVESRLLALQETLDQTLTLGHLSAVVHPDVIYWGHGLLALQNSAPALDTSIGATLALSIVFLGSVYWFTLSLVRQDFSFSPIARCSAGILVVIFTALSLGTSTFSYFRYYAYFPAIFCFPIVFLCVQLLLEYQNVNRASILNLLTIPLFFIVLGLVHLQELLFALILVYGLILWRAAEAFFFPRTNDVSKARVHYRIATICVLATPLLIWMVLRFGTLRPWGYTPHTVGLPDWIPLLGGLPVANPTFRFWDTLGFFGVLGYIIYVTSFKQFQRSGYAFVGMVSPLLTHFNPLYVYLFLHLNSSTTVWRTSYLVPLAYVVSVFLVKKITCLMNQSSLKRLAVLSITLVLIITTLLPFQIGDYVNRLSRIPSLLPTEVGSGRLLWGDLISEVRRIKKDESAEGFVTDHVTQFVIDSAVLGRIPIRNSAHYFPKHKNEYQGDLLTSDFSGYFLILNNRGGRPSGSALNSGHWASDTLNTSRLYPARIEEFINANPQRFRMVWQKDLITIYQILST